MTFRVENHVLADENIGVNFLGGGGAHIEPELLVIHYGVTHNLSSLVAAQRSRGYWAHLSIDGYSDGKRGAVYEVTQALPFNVRGSHAGRSAWAGRHSVNGFSIGIEISNPGPLIRGDDGKLRTVYGKEWPEDDAIEARQPRTPSNWSHWAKYTDQEIDLCVGIGHCLRDAYGLVDVVGHSEISPGRKSDPGPAFPIEWLRSKLFPEAG